VIKRIGLLVAAALLVATMMVATAAPAFAASRSDRECIAEGGTPTGSGGNRGCLQESGQSGKGWTTDYQGGSGKVTDCENPGGNTNTNQEGTKKCPGR
jgi:hypothetical protein